MQSNLVDDDSGYCLWDKIYFRFLNFFHSDATVRSSKFVEKF